MTFEVPSPLPDVATSRQIRPRQPLGNPCSPTDPSLGNNYLLPQRMSKGEGQLYNLSLN